MQRIEGLITAFGLPKQSDTLIGTPIRKGISGGQKRRVSLASQLVTSPRIVFLDEPTSGLDSHASNEVISFVKEICKKYNILVVASIHQPSTTTFNHFDKILLLSLGSTVYSGPVNEIGNFFARQGFPIPNYTNPAEHILQLVNTDFAPDQGAAEAKLKTLISGWEHSHEKKDLHGEITAVKITGQANPSHKLVEDDERMSTVQKLLVPYTLAHRSLIKGYRDVIAYGIRVAMYLGLAIMMGTVWLRLAPTQDNIIPMTNAIVSIELDVVYTQLNRSVLWWCLHELHGSGLHPIVPRGPFSLHQRARQRTVWTYGLYGVQLHHRIAILV
jgi:hypothetical protein